MPKTACTPAQPSLPIVAISAAVGINRHNRDDTAIRKEDMVERTISVHQDLLAMTRDVFKMRHKPPQIAGRQSEQEPIAGPFG